MGRKKSIFPYSIETPCKCGCGGMVKNPDPWGRYREFLSEHINKGSAHPRYGMKESQDKLEKRVATILATRLKVGPTCLERDLYKYLENNGIKYEPQKQITATIVDAYIPDLNLCIFADGEYWHNKPGAKVRDAKYTKKLEDLGYTVIRLSSWNYGYTLNFAPLVKFLKQKNSLV
jgi:very-short-patch-repair endonuclease